MKTKFDTLLGIGFDVDDILWVIDMGLNLGITRLFAFNITTKKQVFFYEFPSSIAPKGSFIQDLAIDSTNGWVYLADIANPSIIAIDINKNVARRFSHPTLNSQNIDMIINRKIVNFAGKPARVAINPITLSHDKETLFFGAMNGTTWYQLPTKLFKEMQDDEIIAKSIKGLGPKPISDGADTDIHGNHYFTNLQHHGIDVLSNTGELKPLFRDKRLDWPDNVRVSANGYLYIAVNQLYKTPAFTGGKDHGKPPYYIFKYKKKIK